MTAIDVKSLSKEDVVEFLNSFDTVLTDCDGVLWIRMLPIQGSAGVMNAFREIGKKISYVTNNSTKTRQEVVDKCISMGFVASEDEIVCTANLTARYLQELGFTRRAYVLGSEGITKELDKAGIAHCGTGPDPYKSDTSYVFKDNDIGAVIVGFDEHFSYPKMIKAASYLNDPAVHFIGTNMDERFPAGNNIVLPGTGSFVHCIETCSGRKAVVMGKPDKYMSETLLKCRGLDAKRTLMIGDRYNTDILLGARCGFKTLLVLTGVTTLQEVEEWKRSNDPMKRAFVPDYYIESLGDLQPYLSMYKLECSMELHPRNLIN